MSDAPSRPTRSALYKSEIRFGVVMYGGVSLAIYINGVANELYEMVCATPKVRENDPLKGTRAVYRKAALLLGSEELRDRYLNHLKAKEEEGMSRGIRTPSPTPRGWLSRNEHASLWT